METAGALALLITIFAAIVVMIALLIRDVSPPKDDEDL